MSCDAFPGQDVLSAFQTVAPKTTFKEAKTQTNSTGVLACDYELSAHESAGDHTVSLVVKMDDAVFTGDPTHDLSVNKDGFDKNRDNAIQNDVKGDATSDTQTIIVPATDLGAEAYFNDYFTRNSADHTNEAVRSYLSVLRANSPYLIDFDLSYSPLSEVGSNPGLGRRRPVPERCRAHHADRRRPGLPGDDRRRGAASAGSVHNWTDADHCCRRDQRAKR